MFDWKGEAHLCAEIDHGWRLELHPDVLLPDADDAVEQIADIKDRLDRAGKMIVRRAGIAAMRQQRHILRPDRNRHPVADPRIVLETRIDRADRRRDRRGRVAGAAGHRGDPAGEEIRAADEIGDEYLGWLMVDRFGRAFLDDAPIP